jgi:hypothetical protein
MKKTKTSKTSSARKPVVQKAVSVGDFVRLGTLPENHHDMIAARNALERYEYAHSKNPADESVVRDWELLLLAWEYQEDEVLVLLNDFTPKHEFRYKWEKEDVYVNVARRLVQQGTPHCLELASSICSLLAHRTWDGAHPRDVARRKEISRGIREMARSRRDVMRKMSFALNIGECPAKLRDWKKYRTGTAVHRRLMPKSFELHRRYYSSDLDVTKGDDRSAQDSVASRYILAGEYASFMRDNGFDAKPAECAMKALAIISSFVSGSEKLTIAAREMLEELKSRFAPVCRPWTGDADYIHRQNFNLGDDPR